VGFPTLGITAGIRLESKGMAWMGVLLGFGASVAAIVTAFLAYRTSGAKRDLMAGCYGFVLWLVCVAVLLPNVTRAGAWPSPGTKRNRCIANLRQIDGAKEQWALENKLTVGTAADTTAVNGYLKNSQPPACPSGGTYTYGAIGLNPTCSMGASAGHTL